MPTCVMFCKVNQLLVYSAENNIGKIIISSEDMLLTFMIGYEPADFTVHPPPPRTADGGFIFFRIGV